MKYYSMDINELFRVLRSNIEGLKDIEINNRVSKYGKNELPKAKPKSIISIFFSELVDPIIFLLFIAIIASLLVGEYVDALAIFLIVLIDLIIGTVEEVKANNTIMSLAKLVPEKVRVKRNNKDLLIDSKELTIGDIIYLESGDKVPADVRLIDAHNLCVDESILTGESIAVEKKSLKLENKNINITSQKNMVFSGCSILTGRALAIVTEVGINTEIGHIATTLHKTKEEKSPLTIRVEKFSKQISLIIIILGIILTFLLYSKNVSGDEILISVIALAVSAMPEGLPLALTMALTIASNKMARQKVVVKKLHSVEALGSCTTIASDKTGTLTVNEQTAKKILLPNHLEYLITGEGYSTKGKIVGKDLKYALELAKLGVINNEAKFNEDTKIGDSIDLAFLTLGLKAKINIDNINILEIIPYESINQYSAVFYEENDEVYCTIKGSLEVVKTFCNKINLLEKNDFSILDNEQETLSSEGYRVIALASAKIKKKEKYGIEDIKNLTFKGLVGFIDPIRKDAIKAIKDCKSAGIKVLMITGDHPLTAFKIASDLKLTTNYSEVATTEEVEEYLNKSKNEFTEFVKEKIVFARVTPLQKLKIVEALKESGEFVAVTGDGVNDALALKTANIGIAMGSGSDIAIESANMVILDDSFKSIVKGILEGRVAYSNIRKITYFLISCGLAEVLFFILAIIFNLPMPLLAIQLLWLNVVTDGIQDIALSFETAEKNIMKEAPRDTKASLFDKELFHEIIVSGLSIGLLIFIVWVLLLNYFHIEVHLARGYIMVLMIVIQNIHAFNCRSEKDSVFNISFNTNPIFHLGVLGSLILGVAVLEIDFLSKLLKTSHIPITHLLTLIILSFSILVIMELYKKVRYRK